MQLITYARYVSHFSQLTKAVVSGLTLLSLSTLIQAAEINVPDDYLTIQQAMDAAVSNDIIHVGPGVYSEKIDFTGKSVTLRSTDGPESTFINGVTYEGVQMGPGGVFEGFTVNTGQENNG